MIASGLTGPIPSVISTFDKMKNLLVNTTLMMFSINLVNANKQFLQ